MDQKSRVARSCEYGLPPTRVSPDPTAKRTRRSRARCASVSPAAKTLRHTENRAALASAESTFRLVALITDSPSHSLEHATHIDIHADPLRARAAVTINAAIDVVAFDADVC